MSRDTLGGIFVAFLGHELLMLSGLAHSEPSWVFAGLYAVVLAFLILMPEGRIGR